MFDVRDLRAAALGFGLPFLLAPPYSNTALAIEDCAHGLASYRYDMPAAVTVNLVLVVDEQASRPDAIAETGTAPVVFDGGREPALVNEVWISPAFP